MNSTTVTNWSQFPLQSLTATKALITGGAGFIGSHLVHALVQLGVTVVVIDDLSGGGDPKALPDAAKYVHGSILDRPLLDQCMNGCQFVLHQAALGSVPKSVEQPRAFHEANITGTLNVLESARAAGVKRVTFAASSSCYGDSPTLPKIESMPTNPRSPYAATKVAGEALMTAYTASYGLDTACLRYFNIFGPRQSADNAYAAVIAAFAKSLLANKHPVIFGDGQQSRDFTYVDNVVLANLLALVSDKPIGGAAINIACGQRITVTELAIEMAKLLGCPELTPVYKDERVGDVKHSLADLTIARQLLGYKPIVSFKDGLATTVQWYKQTM